MKLLHRSLALGIALSFTGCAGIQYLGVKTIQLVSGDSGVFHVKDEEPRDASSFTEKEEYFLGRAVTAQLLSQYNWKPTTAVKQDAYVRDILGVLVSASDRPETFAGYFVTILPAQELNAMSAPGGHITVTQSLLSLCQSEDEIAAVLAHELAHIERKDGLSSISAAHRSSYAIPVGEAVSALDCAGISGQVLTAFSGAVEDVVQTLRYAGFSREQELATDARAYEILTKAGYDPRALASVFKRLEAQKIAAPSGWFATHPTPADRLAALGDRGDAEVNEVRQKRFLKFR